MLKEEYFAEILDLRLNQGWAYTEIMRKFNCSYPEIKNLVEAYKTHSLKKRTQKKFEEL